MRNFAVSTLNLSSKNDDISSSKILFLNETQSTAFFTTFRNLSVEKRHRFLQQLLSSCKPSDLSFIHGCISKSSKLKIDFISELPKEISVLILANLPGETCIRASRVCKAWYNLIYDNDLWRKICRRRGWIDDRLICLQRNHLPYPETPSISSPISPDSATSKPSFEELLRQHHRISVETAELTMDCVKIPSFVLFDKQWKKVFIDKYLTRTNWERGRCKIRTIKQAPSLSPVTNDRLPRQNRPNDIDQNRHDRNEDDGNEAITISFAEDLEHAVAVTSSTDGTQGQFWNVSTGDTRFLLRGHQGAISTVKITKNLIVTGGKTNIYLFAPLNNVMIGVDRTLRIWNGSTGESFLVMEGHEGEIECLEVAGEKMVVTGSQDKTIRVWDISRGSCVAVLRGHSDSVTCVQMDDCDIVSGSADSTIRIWDRKTFQCKNILTGHSGVVSCLYLDQKKVISGSFDCKIIIWDRQSGSFQKILEGHQHGVVCLQSDGQEKIVSGSSDQSIKVWSIRTGSLLYTLKRHSAPVWNLKFDESKLMSTSFDRTVVEWNFGGFDSLTKEEREKWSLD